MLVVGASTLGLGLGVASAVTGTSLHASSKIPSQASLDNALVSLQDFQQLPGLSKELFGTVTLPAPNPAALRPCNAPPNKYQPVGRAAEKFATADSGLSFVERIGVYSDAKTATKSLADTKAAVNHCSSYTDHNAAGGQVQITQTKPVKEGTSLSWDATATSGQDSSLTSYTFMQRKNFLISVQTFGPTQNGPFIEKSAIVVAGAALVFDKNKPK
jgi:hypothetical protein